MRDIAAEFGCTEGAIRKRAKAEQWTRDLSEMVRQRADMLIRKNDLDAQKRIKKMPPLSPDEMAAVEAQKVMHYKLRNAEKLHEDDECVENSAQIIATMTIKQRNDITRARVLAISLLTELEATTDNAEMFSQLGEILASQDETGKLNDIYRKVISFPTRIKAMKELAETLRVLIELERKIYKMEDAQGDNPLADFIKRISGNTIKPVIEGDFSEVDDVLRIDL